VVSDESGRLAYGRIQLSDPTTGVRQSSAGPGDGERIAAGVATAARHPGSTVCQIQERRSYAIVARGPSPDFGPLRHVATNDASQITIRSGRARPRRTAGTHVRIQNAGGTSWGFGDTTRAIYTLTPSPVHCVDPAPRRPSAAFALELCFLHRLATRTWRLCAAPRARSSSMVRACNRDKGALHMW